MPDMNAEVLVLGGGPGGYTAAFRAADLGKKVVLVERHASLGGVCLNVGCIPSKSLLHVARVITEAAELSGVRFGEPDIDIDTIRSSKEGTVARLGKALGQLAKRRKVEVVTGTAQFVSPRDVRVETARDARLISFDNAIIAAGSSPARLTGFPYEDPRLIDSTGALALRDVPDRLLVIGGGVVGLEIAAIYSALGSAITIVEAMDQLMPGADADVVKPLANRLAKSYEAVLTMTRVTHLEPAADGLRAVFEGPQAPEPQSYDRVLVAVGRQPNSASLGLESAGVRVSERGFIEVDMQMRTSVPHIFAVGDICGEPMLAHKATREGKVAAEVIAGHDVSFQANAIPSVAYTDPEIAWVGATEAEARRTGLDYETAVFPWAASGRALASRREEGLTKLVLDRTTRRVIGAGIAGCGASELIAETVFAIEMGALAQDLALTIHPHPTLSETIALAAEISDGSITDLYLPRNG